MKPTVFYFEFYDENTEKSIVKGFNINVDFHSISPDCEFNDFCEDSDFSNHVCAMESDYGVHDWSSSPRDEVNGIGYTTYEIPRKNIDLVMDKHRQFFVDLVGEENVTPVVTIGDDVSMDDDYVIYLTIKALTG